MAQEQNDDARAIVLFEKAVQKLPNYAHARIALGSSYMKLKNYARARQELEMAVKLDPEEPTGALQSRVALCAFERSGARAGTDAHHRTTQGQGRDNRRRRRVAAEFFSESLITANH